MAIEWRAPGASAIQLPAARSVRVEVRLAATGVVAGRVFDRGSPTHKAGARVELIPGRRFASTDSDGRYRFGDVLPGEYLCQGLAGARGRREQTCEEGERRSLSPIRFLRCTTPALRVVILAARFAVAPASAFNADLVLSPPSPGRVSGRIENCWFLRLRLIRCWKDICRGLREGWFNKPRSLGADDAAAYSFFTRSRDKLPGESLAIGPIPDFNDEARARSS